MSTTFFQRATRFADADNWDRGASTQIALTSFYGGEARGRCLQITLSRSDVAFIPLTEEDATALRDALNRFLSLGPLDEVDEDADNA